MRELTVYTAPGCCLCDQAAAVLEPLAAELGIVTTWVDITGDAALEAAWREQIPVGFIDGRKVFKYHVDEAMLRRRAGAGVGAGAEPPGRAAHRAHP